MPYSLITLQSLEKRIRRLDPNQKETAKLILRALLAYLAANGDIGEAQKIAPRFFFKMLRRPFYEAGVEGNIRIILRKEELDFTALFIGNHDDIRRFLAQA